MVTAADLSEAKGEVPSRGTTAVHQVPIKGDGLKAVPLAVEKVQS